MDKVPLNDAIIVSLSRLVDDAQTGTRAPSHNDIEFQITKAGLSAFDPTRAGQIVGKAKRVRAVLSNGLEDKPESAECFAAGLINTVKGCGGFRSSSPNFVGTNAIADLTEAIRQVGMSMGEDGSLTHLLLENLSGSELTKALESYVNRAKKGIEDAALVVGTGKDLLEATAAHVLREMYGNHNATDNFPTLLEQAFIALGLKTSADPVTKGEHPRCNLERHMYDLACSINRLRNKQGTGHGRPFMPDIGNNEARASIQLIGIISERLLKELENKAK